MSPAAKLSAQEMNVITFLYDKWTQYPEGVADPKEVWGVGWAVTGTRSQAASFSRTLRRLEARGLVLRQNGISGCPDTAMARKSRSDRHNRTTGVVLLRPGIELAERLTKSRRLDVNRMMA